MNEHALVPHVAAQPESSAIVPAQSPALLFRVPDDELQEFWDLDPEHQRAVNDTFAALEEIHAAPNRKAKAIEIEDRYRGRDGFSVKTLLNKLRLYVRGGYKSGVKKPENYVQAGDWKALVPNYGLPEKKWNPAFLDYLAKLAGEFQRDQGDAAAIRELKLQRWPQGDSIPGYGTWRQEFRRRFPHEEIPADCPPDFFPAGWSDRQLYRLLPDEAHMTAVRHGVAASEEHFAQIMNDRTRLHFGEIIIIDDFWAPFKVRYNRSIAYCVGLAAMDWASGAWIHHALMPREQMPDGTRKSLTAAHMRWFIIGLLRVLRGLPRGERTITLLVENNTASVPTELEDLLKQVFNGRVLIKRSGLIRENQGAILDHGFRESGGKWRAEGKGLIESGFNLFKNEVSNLPGQRGSKERTNGHAAFADSERYAVALLQNKALTEHHVQLLKLPFVTYEHALDIVRAVFDRINAYREHRCRGFMQVTEWRLSEKDAWTPYGTLPTPEQAALIAQGVEIIDRVKPESRAMRARRLHDELEWTPVAESAFIPLMADRFKPVTVTAKKQIVIRRTGADALVFYSARAVAEGLLVPGKEYRGFFYDEEPEAIHLTPVDSLRVLGFVERFGAVDPRDDAARGRAYAETCAPKRTTAERIRHVHQDEERQLITMREHNAEVVAAAEAGRAIGSSVAQARLETRKQTAAAVKAQKQDTSKAADRARRLLQQDPL